MNETDFYQRHVRKMEQTLHLARIENSVGSGFPDISAAGDGKQFLIETKVAKVHMGDDTLFFEKFQIPFAMKRLRYTNKKGMFVIALCKDEEEICVFVMQSVIAAPRSVYKKWTTVKLCDLGEPFARLERPFSVAMMNGIAEKMIRAS